MYDTRRWVVLTALLVGSAAAGQPLATEAEAPRPLNVVAFDAMGMTRSALQIDGERVLTDRISVRLGLKLSLSAMRSDREDPVIAGDGFTFSQSELNSRTYAVAVEPGVRIYLMGRAPEGLWTGLHFGVGMGSSWSEGATAGLPSTLRETNLFTLSGDALVGYSLLLSRGFTLQAAVGLGVLSTTYTDWPTHLNAQGEPLPGQPPARTQRWDVGPSTRLAFGWAF